MLFVVLLSSSIFLITACTHLGALYKALACFALRDVDFSKIESRPTPVQILQQLKFSSTPKISQDSHGKEFKSSTSNFINSRYAFYLDFLASEFDDSAQNALMHLKEQVYFSCFTAASIT